MSEVFIELDPKQTKIAVYFRYDEETKEIVKRMGGRFVGRDKGGPYWTLPLDLDYGQRLRQEFGQRLTLGQGITAWGRDERRRQRNLRSLSTANDATLRNVNGKSASWLRPYQRADVAMMANTNVLNLNQPGTGKTVEVIYSIQEAQLPGPHLVVCPISLFKDPWRNELAAHAPNARVIYGDTPQERRGAINFVWSEFKDGRADDIWLLLNPEMIRVKKWEVAEQEILMGTPVYGAMSRLILSKDHKGNAYLPKCSDYMNPGAEARLFMIEWGLVEADEFHKFGLGADRNTQYARGLDALRKNAQKASATSGTPTGGKPVRLWGPLHFIEPDLYPGKWKWAQKWLTDADGTGPVEPGAGTGIGGIQPGREEEFYQAHAKHIVRRTRREVMPGAPEKQTIDVWVEMTPKQKKAYDAFMKDAEVTLAGGRVSADGILSEYARGKQFANALCEIRNGEVHPTEESGKLPVLLDKLDTYGIRKNDPEPGARAIVGSESQRFVALVETYLRKQGINVKRLDGTVVNTKREAARDNVIDWFKEDNKQARVLVMTTQTGGVGLNLPQANSIHIMDESWNPDDQEQLEDRGRAETYERDTVLSVLYYRTKDTVQEYIYEIGLGKTSQNKKVMADELRRAIRERSK